MLKIMSLNRWTSIEQFEFCINMKTIIFLTVIAFAFADPEHYNVAVLDVDKLSKDPSEWKSLIDCMLDRAPCSSVYAPYRAIVQDAIDTLADKCNPEQKRAFWQFLKALYTLSPEDYTSFRHKYDPHNKHFDILEMILSRYASW